MSKLTKTDYIKILSFYKKEIPDTFQTIKSEAENILVNKLCRCIKKIEGENEAKSIGYCTKTVVNNKGFKRGKFNCTGKQFAIFTKVKTKTNTKKNKRRKNKGTKKNIKSKRKK
jgi:hypothetical protein